MRLGAGDSCPRGCGGRNRHRPRRERVRACCRVTASCPERASVGLIASWSETMFLQTCNQLSISLTLKIAVQAAALSHRGCSHWGLFALAWQQGLRTSLQTVFSRLFLRCAIFLGPGGCQPVCPPPPRGSHDRPSTYTHRVHFSVRPSIRLSPHPRVRSPIHPRSFPGTGTCATSPAGACPSGVPP